MGGGGGRGWQLQFPGKEMKNKKHCKLLGAASNFWQAGMVSVKPVCRVLQFSTRSRVCITDRIHFFRVQTSFY